ncbi:MAG: glycosyltransferase family 4 protein [Alphaproteobacteria bacterium]|nr:glycosyltransferase family 4 protein [Alphaproteobacteria bacterium]
MRVLFLHNNFPAQYRFVATALAADPRNRVVFGTANANGELPGVTRVHYKPARAASPATHHYIRNLEEAVLTGQAVYRMALELKRQGFEPDIVCGHSGWGPTLYVKDAFPKTKLLCYFEWFYRSRGSDADFVDPASISLDDECRIRTRNAPILLDLAQCDAGVSPTEFQRAQFPEPWASRLHCLHDGIDVDFFSPEPGAKLVLPGVDLSHAPEIVTYATRGMEPYRGFPQFMRAVALLQKRRPDMHAVVVGDDRVAYGRKLPEGQSYRQKMLEELPDLDLARLHFTGSLPYPLYRQVLRASSVHVYLTVPFVLSWSLMESLATGCLVVGSDTAPIREMIADNHNGLLADFFSPEHLAERIGEALDDPGRMAPIRAAARQGIVERYALRDLLPRHVRLIREVAAAGA